jgi:hypothetical protein
MQNGISLLSAALAASTLILASTLMPISYAQSNATSTGNTTTTASANNTAVFESAKQEYLLAWNQTRFASSFDTFIEPNTDMGYGIYTTHRGDVFRPGDMITFYVEPVGFSHQPVLDEFGDTHYQINLTASVTIEDQSGSVLATIEDFPPFLAVSHQKNTEMYLTVTVTQQQPFPDGMYKLTYTVTDSGTGESFVVSKKVRIAQTVST